MSQFRRISLGVVLRLIIATVLSLIVWWLAITRFDRLFRPRVVTIRIWPADRENPLGWTNAGKTGTKAECLAYIQEVWTDMRPLSLRKKMQEMGYP